MSSRKTSSTQTTSGTKHPDWTGGKSLWVKGREFCAGAYIKKNPDGTWRVIDIAPYLAKIVRGIPIAEWGKKFDSIGAEYKWLEDKDIENGYDFEQRMRKQQEAQQELFDE
jgi:hypothetical protein